MRVADLMKFASERHLIYKRREAGQPKPWTKDKILRTFRFTNMYRELDRDLDREELARAT